MDPFIDIEVLASFDPNSNAEKPPTSWGRTTSLQIIWFSLPALQCLLYLYSVDLVFLPPAAAAKSLQQCPILCDPIDGGALSLGFSRQEHWSGLPFPSLMHASEKQKWSHWVLSNSQRPHGLQPTRLLQPCRFPGKSTGVGCHCLLCSYPQGWVKLRQRMGVSGLSISTL